MHFLRDIISGAICLIIIGLTDFGHLGNIIICIITFGIVRLIFTIVNKGKIIPENRQCD